MNVMICPHCGKNTDPKALCDHCRKPTEFVARSNIYPGEIPGLKEKADFAVENDDKQPVDVPNIRKFVYIALMLLAAVAVCVAYFCFSLNKKQRMVSTEKTFSQTELPCTEAIQQAHQILLIRNAPWQTETQEEDSVIQFGEILPVLSDEQGYTFLGWNTDPVGEGMFFRPGDRFSIHLTEELILYGQWKMNTTPSIENKSPDFDILPRETGNTIPESVETTEEMEPIEIEEKTLLTEGGEQL